MKRIFISGLLLLLAACSAPAPIAQPKVDRMLGAWQVMTTPPGKGEMLCYAVTAPVKSEGTIGPRGVAYLMATRRASGKIEISATAGYTFMPGSKTELVIDDDSYRLFFKDSVAWSHDDEEDRDIIASLKDDAEDVEVRGLSKTGFTSVDYYTPQGFEEAIDRIRELCP